MQGRTICVRELWCGRDYYLVRWLKGKTPTKDVSFPSLKVREEK